jgi:hypothetical protein
MISGKEQPSTVKFMPLELYEMLQEKNLNLISEPTLQLILAHNPDIAAPGSQRPIFLYTQNFLDQMNGAVACFNRCKILIGITVVLTVVFLIEIPVAFLTVRK